MIADLRDCIDSLPPATIWMRLRYRLNDVTGELRRTPYNVRRSIAVVKAYWGTYDFDWTALGVLMRFQIGRTRQTIQKNSHLMNAERVCRDMLICETLLTRLMDESYYEIADVRYPERGERWARFINELEAQDMAMLMDKLNHMREWWD